MNIPQYDDAETLVAAMAEMFLNVDVDYLQRTFGSLENRELYALENCLIVLFENGDAEKGCIGSIVSQWWEFYDGRTRFVAYPDSLTLKAVGGLDFAAHLKLYRENDRVALGETYGPNLIARRIGKSADLKPGARFEDFSLTWASQ